MGVGPTVRLIHDDVGGGPPVVLVHGHPFDASMRLPQLAALGTEFRVLAPDLRGYGLSPATTGTVTMAELAEDVWALFDELDVATAAVVGLSMGGLVAMEMSISDPKRRMMRGNNPVGAAAALRGRACRPDYRQGLRDLNVPSFVCAGTGDPWSAAEVTHELVECRKNCRTSTLPDVGHLPNLEAQGRFNVELSSFLRDPWQVRA